MSNIVVLGAGVSGLTTALTILRSNADHKVTIVAKHMPGDYDIEYASPWAGANFLPPTRPHLTQYPSIHIAPARDGNIYLLTRSTASMSKPGTPTNDYERNSWPEVERLARDVPEAGIHFQEAREYRRDKDANTAVGQWMAETVSARPWFADVVPNFRQLSAHELPPGVDGGSSFTSICLNPPLYLAWLASQCIQRGAVLRRGIATHVSAAAALHHSGARAQAVVNCTGLSARQLDGVRDGALYPARGQIVVVRNSPGGGIMSGTSGVDDAPAGDEVCYIMNRPAGGGCVLGGCFQPHNWDGQPDLNLATRIMKRAVDLCPSLVQPGQGVEGLSVVRHAVGLRPMRDGGPRVESEVVDSVVVVHNYGHGGYGYQTSWGSAARAAELLREALKTKTKLKLKL